MNNERNNTTAGGIGFCGLLAVAFIVLKLTGVINWSWLWVLAPIWIPTAITLAIIVIVLVVILVRELTPAFTDVIVKRYIRITGKTTVRCVRQGRELPREEIAAIFEPDEEGGEQE